ncbi:hypothetical protein Tco_1258303 [Tanacetum coccineum]
MKKKMRMISKDGTISEFLGYTSSKEEEDEEEDKEEDEEEGEKRIKKRMKKMMKKRMRKSRKRRDRRRRQVWDQTPSLQVMQQLIMK